MTSAAWPLQRAVFSALAADANLNAVAGGRIFDAVPRGATFPYVVLGDGGEADNGTATEEGTEHTLSFRIWSRGGGQGENKRVAAALRTALETASLPLEGHRLIALRFVSADYARLSDGETYRAVIRFKALTEPL